MIAIKKRIAEQQQYSRRETVELAGLPDNTKTEEQKNKTEKHSKKRESKSQTRSFHAIHRLQNKKVVINSEISKST